VTALPLSPPFHPGPPDPDRESGAPAPMPSAAVTTLGRSVAALLGRQHEEGWWKGELETNVTMDAEDLLLRQFLGIRTVEQTAAAAKWIRSRQRDDGTWATYYGGPADLSTTIEAYVALKLAGDAVDAPHMRLASDYIRQQGGIGASRVFTRIWLALFGKWPWESLPILLPELMLLPPWFPLNVYDFGCWARQTVVALTVINAHRPVHELSIDIDELNVGPAPVVRHPFTSWARRFATLDRALHIYERRPISFVRRFSLGAAERWILKRQESDGSWGGIQPPWVYSLMALHLQGYDLDHPVMRAGLEGLDGFTIEDEAGRRIEACQSPVWDTALAVVALADAGVSPDDPALRAAGQWLVREEITVPGDWTVRRPHLAPGGWAFEFANDNYPDIDDTAEVVLALQRTQVGDGGSVARGVEWTEGMQCKDGGWAAFDVDNTRALCRELPFCDFGELIDPPSADVTAHVVEMLSVLGRKGPSTDRGVTWLLNSQEPDGSWFGRWGSNLIYGTAAVVPALIAAGVSPDHIAVRRAVAWIEEHQNGDGGWGEDLRSYADPEFRGRGVSNASQTAWALLVLLAAGARGAACERGVAFLVEIQLPDGTWDETWFTGTGFPGDFSINYHLYHLVFPVMALGRYVHGWAHGDSTPLLTADPGPTTVERAVRPERPRRQPKERVASAVPVGASGSASALHPWLHPGDLVVATELRTTDGMLPRRLPVAELLASDLRRSGLSVRTGPLVISSTVLSGPERAALAAAGAIALDAGSDSETLNSSEPPVAVVRVIVEPGRSDVTEVTSRSLGEIKASLERWARANGPHDVLLASPRSFCAGVERAIEIVERSLERFGGPVYVRRQIVHNKHVVSDLEAKGAVFVTELDEVPDGATVVLAAHGVSPAVRAAATNRSSLTVIDATCPLVAKVHHEARRYVAQDYQIVLVGHAGHEEVVGTLGEAPDRIRLVQGPEDVADLVFDSQEPVAYLTQTTLSTDETAEVVDALRERFPDLVGPTSNDICYATQNRQDAVRAIAHRCDLMLVVGSANSSNAARLVEVAEREGCRAELIEDVSEIHLSWFDDVRRVGLTAGASAPESLVSEIIDALMTLGPTTITEHRTTEETVQFSLPRQVR
jgi:squalene-hopene/tetraprenyl-beta-curcumene cyclase